MVPVYGHAAAEAMAEPSLVFGEPGYVEVATVVGSTVECAFTLSNVTDLDVTGVHVELLLENGLPALPWAFLSSPTLLENLAARSTTTVHNFILRAEHNSGGFVSMPVNVTILVPEPCLATAGGSLFLVLVLFWRPPRRPNLA